MLGRTEIDGVMDKALSLDGGEGKEAEKLGLVSSRAVPAQWPAPALPSGLHTPPKRRVWDTGQSRCRLPGQTGRKLRPFSKKNLNFCF